MRRNLPPLNWLRAFEASARQLSFTSAAAELNLTQAAVSKQIKLLEQYLREPLFHRKARSLALTKAGSAYLPKVRDAIERLAAGTQEVFGNRRSEVLTIRATVGLSVNWLAPRLPGFYRRFPDKPVRILSSVWSDEPDQDRYDLDIRYGSGRWQGFRADRLSWDEIQPVCSRALISGKQPLREPGDLRHHDLLHVLGYEEGWAVWLKAAGVDDIEAGGGYQFDTTLMAFEVAARGIGVALGRSSITDAAMASGRLVAPFALSVPIDEAFYLISPLDGSEHPDAELFREWLQDEVEAERS